MYSSSTPMVNVLFTVCNDTHTQNLNANTYLRMAGILKLLTMSLRLHISMHVAAPTHEHLDTQRAMAFSQRILTEHYPAEALCLQPSVERDAVCACCDLTGKHTMLINCLDGTQAGWITPASIANVCSVVS
jgi:hypothetical protein